MPLCRTWHSWSQQHRCPCPWWRRGVPGDRWGSLLWKEVPLKVMESELSGLFTRKLGCFGYVVTIPVSGSNSGQSGNNVNWNCSQLIHLRSSAVCYASEQAIANLRDFLALSNNVLGYTFGSEFQYFRNYSIPDCCIPYFPRLGSAI